MGEGIEAEYWFKCIDSGGGVTVSFTSRHIGEGAVEVTAGSQPSPAFPVPVWPAREQGPLHWVKPLEFVN